MLKNMKGDIGMNNNSLRDVIIYELNKGGETKRSLAKRYCLTSQRISQIVNRVDGVKKGKQNHGPTTEAIKIIKSDRKLEVMLLTFDKLRSAADNLIDFSNSAMFYAPECRGTLSDEYLDASIEAIESAYEELNCDLFIYLQKKYSIKVTTPYVI